MAYYPTPLIILGAPRSGTNLLRDILCTYPLMATWPCDEINPIWRYGVFDYPHDELPVSLITSVNTKYIRNRFLRLASMHSVPYVVEKTCANSLRVPYVSKILPEAKYIVITRSGFDCALSASIKWSQRPDLAYLLQKSLCAPPSFHTFYFRKLLNTFTTSLNTRRQDRLWGPIYREMSHDLNTLSTLEVCGKQWRSCTQSTYESLQLLSLPYFHLNYESLVRDPFNTLSSLFQFLGLDINDKWLAKLSSPIYASSIGLAEKTLNKELLDQLKKYVEYSPYE